MDKKVMGTDGKLYYTYLEAYFAGLLKEFCDKEGESFQECYDRCKAEELENKGGG